MKSSTVGRLIVIEGGDGSGKGTQSTLLCTYLKSESIPYEYIDFPDYDSFYGHMIGQFLRGEFGALNVVSPYLAALLFALDRKEKATQIADWLKEGKIVVANRYVTSNIAHQASKYTSEEERNTFIQWVESLEYTQNGMPREHIVLYLAVSSGISHALTQSKSLRPYLKGQKIDIQESDIEYRMRTEELYEYLAKQKKHWVKINCIQNGTILPKEDIHIHVVECLKNAQILS